ncbi:MAG: hypothetical protein R3C11_23830 [Planctomycetaceae bacterium]
MKFKSPLLKLLAILLVAFPLFLKTDFSTAQEPEVADPFSETEPVKKPDFQDEEQTRSRS